MNYFFGNNVPVLLVLSLVFLANAQRRDVDELERQNKITQQILEAFIQKKLGLKTTVPKAPSILDILPVKMPISLTPTQPEVEEDMEEEEEEQENMDSQEITDEHELREDDSLQSVESEQIDSIYNTEGRTKKYATPAV